MQGFLPIPSIHPKLHRPSIRHLKGSFRVEEISPFSNSFPRPNLILLLTMLDLQPRYSFSYFSWITCFYKASHLEAYLQLHFQNRALFREERLLMLSIFSFLFFVSDWPIHLVQLFLQSVSSLKDTSLNLLKSHFDFTRDVEQRHKVDRQIG